MNTSCFNRYELKSILNPKNSETMVKDLSCEMKPDCMGDMLGGYTVTSLYYDTISHKFYQNHLEGYKFRRKLRIRTYGRNYLYNAELPCFVEIKQHFGKKTLKKRLKLKYELATKLCSLGQQPDSSFSDEEQGIIQDILYISSMLRVKPICIIRYQRLAFDGKDPMHNLRVTFDTNIVCRFHSLNLIFQNNEKCQYVLTPEDSCIMEIKTDGNIPYWLSQLAAKNHFRVQGFSKYCKALEQSGYLSHYGT